MLRLYLKIWDWELIFGREVKAISSPGVRSPCQILTYLVLSTYFVDSPFSYAVDEAAKLRASHNHLDTYYHYFTFPGSHSLANLDLDGSVRKQPLMPLR